MTLKEYAQKVGTALREAHNKKDMQALQRAFADADQTLKANAISPESQKAFWGDVREAAFSGAWLKEAQANSSLLVLMQAIEAGLSARAK